MSKNQEDAFKGLDEPEGPATKEELVGLQEIQRLQIQKALIENELLAYQLEDLKLKKARRAQSHLQNEKDLADQIASEKARFAQCNHRKGGRGLEAVQGRGADSDYCVIKHQLPNGEWFVLCTRCRKPWRKPILGEPDYEKKNKEYLEAVDFPTDNQPSKSSIFQFKFLDGSEAPVSWGNELPKQAARA